MWYPGVSAIGLHVTHAKKKGKEEDKVSREKSKTWAKAL
jgi:hypothetical protein